MSRRQARLAIDLRSDTVTLPTDGMRQAMAQAEVGDDVFGEDPTVKALEERVARLTGKPAALFVPSGTMANLIAVLVHVPRGGEIIADEESHLVLNEGGGAAFLGSAMVRTLVSDRSARFEERQLERAFRDPANVHHPRTTLVMLENTHAHRMGMPLDPEYTMTVANRAHEHGVRLHVDGARVLNAAIALEVPVHQLLEPADSGSLCLSKGLACPAGSVLIGSEEFIASARRARKALGGGQRQIGVLAAAGLVALQSGPAGTIDRMVEDHHRAHRLASGLASIEGLDVEPDLVRTNIVIFGLADKAHASDTHRDRLIEALSGRGVLMMRYPRGRIRAVTHLDVDDAGIDTAVDAVASVVRESLARSRPVSSSGTRH